METASSKPTSCCKRLWLRILIFLFWQRCCRYVAWKDYESGMSGNGPGPYEAKPKHSKPWLPKILKDRFDAASIGHAQKKQSIFADAVEAFARQKDKQ